MHSVCPLTFVPLLSLVFPNIQNNTVSCIICSSVCKLSDKPQLRLLLGTKAIEILTLFDKIQHCICCTTLTV